MLGTPFGGILRNSIGLHRLPYNVYDLECDFEYSAREQLIMSWFLWLECMKISD